MQEMQKIQGMENARKEKTGKYKEQKMQATENVRNGRCVACLSGE